MKMRKKQICYLLALLVISAGCVMVPKRGSGGEGSFQTALAPEVVTQELAGALRVQGYDVSIESNVTQATLDLEYPSRVGFLKLTWSTGQPGEYDYQWRLTHGVLDHHEARAKQEFLETLDRVLGKWSAQPEAGGYRR